MRAYKVGDKVVVAKVRGENPDPSLLEMVGNTYKVEAVYQDLRDIYPYLLKGIVGGMGQLCFAEDELVLEEVYNSPLYKAMREE
jgi:hypothetical protein